MVIRRQVKKLAAESPKNLANLIDIVNLPSTVREFMGQSQSSRLDCFIAVWDYIKANGLLDKSNRNIVNCDDKLKSIILGRQRVELTELPALVKLHFPKQSK